MTRNVQVIRVHHEKYLKLVRYPEATRQAAYEAKVPSFREQARRTLFDIAACKRLQFSSCSCEKSKKVLVPEPQFLHDQRTDRYMMIGRVDIPTSFHTSSFKRRHYNSMVYHISFLVRYHLKHALRTQYHFHCFHC